MGLTRISGDVIQTPLNVGVVTATGVNVGTAVTIHTGGFRVGSSDLHSSGLTVQNLNSTGVVTATSFVGNITGNVTGNATGLSGTPNITVGSITASSATITGNVSVAGTVTYDDVTNVDSIGVITARSGVVIGTGASVSSPTTNVLTLGTNSVERVRIDSSGRLGIGTVPTGSSAKLFVASNALSSGSSSSDGGIVLTPTTSLSTGQYTPAISFSPNPGAPDRSRAGIAAVSNDATNGMDLVFLTRYGADGTELILSTNEKLRITSSGSIGIGTNNPSSRLHVVDGTITVGDVVLGNVYIDIMKMWRTADIQGYKNDYSDGGSISYTWDNGTVRVDTSVGSHNWDIGKVRLPVGVYQIYLQYRPSPTQHGWNVYGTNSNAHHVRLISDAGYGSFNTFLTASGQLNKDVGYSYLFKSGTYEVSSETTYRINMGTDPYTTGGYKCFVEASYLIKIR